MLSCRSQAPSVVDLASAPGHPLLCALYSDSVLRVWDMSTLQQLGQEKLAPPPAPASDPPSPQPVPAVPCRLRCIPAGDSAAALAVQMDEPGPDGQAVESQVLVYRLGAAGAEGAGMVQLVGVGSSPVGPLQDIALEQTQVTEHLCD